MCICAQLLGLVQLFVTQWTVAHQAPLSMDFSRQEYWSGLPFPSPDLSYQVSNPCLLCLLHSVSFFTAGEHHRGILI